MENNNFNAIGYNNFNALGYIVGANPVRDYSVPKEVSNKLPYIIALDFDGTLVEDKFPAIGGLRPDILDRVRVAQAKGYKIVLWTCRDGKNLKDAVEFCNSIDLHFDAINENLAEVKVLYDNDTRKVFANEYWDDKAIGCMCDNTFSCVSLNNKSGGNTNEKR